MGLWGFGHSFVCDPGQAPTLDFTFARPRTKERLPPRRAGLTHLKWRQWLTLTFSRYREGHLSPQGVVR